jgi:hypothetical protein
MGIPLDKASLLALFLETLFYGVFPTSGRRHDTDFHCSNRRVFHIVLFNNIHPTQEIWHKPATPHPSRNCAALYRNGRQCTCH